MTEPIPAETCYNGIPIPEGFTLIEDTEGNVELVETASIDTSKGA